MYAFSEEDSLGLHSPVDQGGLAISGFRNLWVFQAERTPGALQPVARPRMPLETILVPLGSLEASDKFGDVDKAFFYQ